MAWDCFYVMAQGCKGETVIALRPKPIWARSPSHALNVAIAYMKHDLGLEPPMSAEIYQPSTTSEEKSP